MNYTQIATEKRHPKSGNLDLLSSARLVALMNREDRKVLRAVAGSRSAIGRGIDLVALRLRAGGRLFFVGAGTSGRLGVLEAAECPPTFNSSPEMIQAIMAGGRGAVFRSKEGAEDSEQDAVKAIRREVRHGDVVVGVAASGVTPFVRAALRQGRSSGAGTILVTCNPAARERVDIRIALSTGPEILAGSTRLKAGTACKMVLNMLTTGSMIQLGKVYGNRMVDLQPKSRKLVARGIGLVQELARVDEKQAQKLYRLAKGRVKTAIVMGRLHLSPKAASSRLAEANGYLRKALE